MDYRICSSCVMDTTDKFITFDDNGVCNHCLLYEKRKQNLIQNSHEKHKALTKIIHEIKQSSKNKQYDCIVGVSGGVDSSYVLFGKAMGVTSSFSTLG